MKVRTSTRNRLLAAATVAAVAALAAGSIGSAGGTAEAPQSTSAKPAALAKAGSVGDSQRQITSLGASDRYGLELFVTTLGGRTVGMPMG